MIVSTKENKNGVSSHVPFSTVVVLQIAGRWHFVESVEQAFHCLTDAFSDTQGASFKRALSIYDAVCSGHVVAADGFCAAFIVAAMEAGYPYELYERNEALVELRVSAAAEHAILDIILN